jgi:hypothetical protein
MHNEFLMNADQSRKRLKVFVSRNRKKICYFIIIHFYLYTRQVYLFLCAILDQLFLQDRTAFFNKSSPYQGLKNVTERNGFSDIFSETEWKIFEKMRNENNITKFKETKLKRKNNSEKKHITKNVEFFFCLWRNILFWKFKSQNLSSIQINLI